MNMRTLICFALFCLVSCKAQRPMGDTIDGLDLLQRDGYSGVADFEGHAIRDQKTLKSFYSQINRTRKPGLPVPSLDFGTEMALLIFLGEQAGEKKVMVSKLSENGSEIVLAIEIGEDPDKNKGTDPGSRPILQPFYLYRMPLTEKSILFEKVNL